MKRKLSMGGYFFPTGQDKLVFQSANNLRNLFFQLFFVLGGCSILVEFSMILRGWDPVWQDLAQGKELGSVALFLSPFVLPFIGLLFPKVHVEIDRVQGVVRHRQGARRYEFPWSQITYSHQWFPTKVGGATLFTLHADPPFPEALERWIEKKKRRPPPGQIYQFNLGSFDVKGPEHGQAIFVFLDAWMRSQDPAEALYKSLIYDRFKE